MSLQTIDSTVNYKLSIWNDSWTAPRQVFVSHPHGKMEGIPTITTSMMCNPICAKRAQDKTSICAHCYAQRGLKIYKAARDRYAENTEQLSSHDLMDYEIPTINSRIARFESHGDLVNVTHAKNYLRICVKNPWCTFAIWTKNASFMDAAIQELGKPDNLVCVLSSDHLNQVTQEYTKYPWVDKVFTVFDKPFIKEHDVQINCGAKHCLSCHKCYEHNGEFFINEVLK